jgi:heme-degrading monooxygenase HmoA
MFLRSAQGDSPKEIRLMIARTWRGATRAADADAYVAYLYATGLKAYRDTPGNRGAFCFRRIVGDRAEFITLSFWESESAITAFAGEDIGRAVYYPEDDRFLVERGLIVDHYEVVFASTEAMDG